MGIQAFVVGFLEPCLQIRTFRRRIQVDVEAKEYLSLRHLFRLSLLLGFQMLSGFCLHYLCIRLKRRFVLKKKFFLRRGAQDFRPRFELSFLNFQRF